MSDGATILTRIIGDALAGKPVKLGWTETPKLLSAIQQLKGDPAGRSEVFAACVDGALRDPEREAQLVGILMARGYAVTK